MKEKTYYLWDPILYRKKRESFWLLKSYKTLVIYQEELKSQEMFLQLTRGRLKKKKTINIESVY